MRRAICRLPEGGTITAQIDETGRTFRAGDVVDLDAIAVPARAGRQPETWEDVLGAHAGHHFELEPAVQTSARLRQAPGAVAAKEE